MFIRIRKGKAQSLTEFAMIMALVLGAIGIMQRPIRQAIWRKIQYGVNQYQDAGGGNITANGTTLPSEAEQSTSITETVDYGSQEYSRTGCSSSNQNATHSF